MKSIARTLLLPYFIFSALISLPKNLVHGNEINIMNICEQIILGQASWFIAALCLSKAIFAVTIWIARGKIWLCSSSESWDLASLSTYPKENNLILGN